MCLTYPVYLCIDVDFIPREGIDSLSSRQQKIRLFLVQCSYILVLLLLVLVAPLVRTLVVGVVVEEGVPLPSHPRTSSVSLRPLMCSVCVSHRAYSPVSPSGCSHRTSMGNGDSPCLRVLASLTLSYKVIYITAGKKKVVSFPQIHLVYMAA